MSVLSRRYSPPGTNAYATVKVFTTSSRALIKNAQVYVLAIYLFEAARPNTRGIIDMRNTAKVRPPTYPVQSLYAYVTYAEAEPYANQSGEENMLDELPNRVGRRSPTA